MGNAELIKALKPLDVLVEETKNRPAKFKEADLSCVKAIAQAAINVELFTIPLYMTALYSIQGTHQITSKNSDLYEGRWWPGAGPAAPKDNCEELTTNQKVFNNVYSVFIEEMLHLQLASNMASSIGVTPTFTSAALQSDTYGWDCYNPATNAHTIPHILSFKDCNKSIDSIDKRLKAYFIKHYPGKSLQDIQVKLDAMNDTQALLFLAIEETEKDAHKLIQEKYWKYDAPGFEAVGTDKDENSERPKYFEQAPYNWWKKSDTEADLPLFGSIGYMYTVYWNYLEIEYDDETTLLDSLVNGIQRDEFNGNDKFKQYPDIDTTIKTIDLDAIKLQLINNIDAITDQGEGGEVVSDILALWGSQSWAIAFKKSQERKKAEQHDVKEKFQPDVDSLKALYPGYNDKGVADGVSGSAYARIYNKAKDHFETFGDCLELILKNTHKDLPRCERYLTWDVWHKENTENKNDEPWTAEMLNPDSTESKYGLPCAKDVASALNNLGAADQVSQTHKTFSLSSVGTLKGLTTALDAYWNGSSSQFPGPAMGGSGDRVSICWATTGMIPDLINGIAAPTKGNLYNACQGMNYMAPMPADVSQDKMPDVVTYHSCKGSNACMAQGGCGFVQSDAGGGNCSQSVAPVDKDKPDIKSAPGDNKCGSFGGCAVPISASQLFPGQDEDDPKMKLYEFGKREGEEGYHSIATNSQLKYQKGDGVYDIAWQAYCLTVGGDMKANLTIDSTEEAGIEIVKATIKNKPDDTDIRLALPPST